MEWTKDKVNAAVGSVTTDSSKDDNGKGDNSPENPSQGKGGNPPENPSQRKGGNPPKNPSQGRSTQGGLSGYANRAYRGLTGAAGEAYDDAGDFAGDTYDQAGDAAGDMYDEAGNNLGDLTSSFQPDPNLVWEGYVIYGILAAGSTMFWWASISAADYLQSVYPGIHIIRWFAFAYFGPWLISYILVSVFWRNASSWLKINVGLLLSFYALFKLALLSGLLIGDEGTTTTLWMMLAEVAVAGCADSITRGCIIGVASELPEGFMKSSVCGFVGSGVFAFIVRVITKASLGSSKNGLAIGAVIHFCICALFLILAIALFVYIHQMPSMSYYDSLNLGSSETIRLLIQNEDSVSLEVASGAAIATIATGRPSPPPPLQWLSLVDKIQLLLIAVAVTSLISFSIFPAYLTEDVHSSELGTWYPLLLVGTYVIFDLLGGVTTFVRGQQKHSTVLALALARLLLVVVFILALIYGPGHTSSMIIIFLLTAILGYSNGYLVVILSYILPKSTSVVEAETATIISSVVLYTFALIGVGLSWIFASSLGPAV